LRTGKALSFQHPRFGAKVLDTVAKLRSEHFRDRLIHGADPERNEDSRTSLRAFESYGR
jgi:hypothetical protein